MEATTAQRKKQEKTPFRAVEGLKRRMDTGARDRDRTDTPPFGKAADFKSAVSTNFTTRAAWDAEELLKSAVIVSQTTNKKAPKRIFS